MLSQQQITDADSALKDARRTLLIQGSMLVIFTIFGLSNFTEKGASAVLLDILFFIGFFVALSRYRFFTRIARRRQQALTYPTHANDLPPMRTVLDDTLKFSLRYPLRNAVFLGIEIHPEGLQVQHSSEIYRLRWNEARVFATYRYTVKWYPFRGLDAGPYYELSGVTSEGEVVTLTWLLPAYNKSARFDPPMDRAAYTQFADQLISLIKTQTGLALLHFDNAE